MNGLFVPKRATYKQKFQGESKAWEVKWLRQKVNEPLPYDIFGLKNLGVTSGEMVYDQRVGMGSISLYEKGKIPEAPPKEQPRR